MDLQHLDTFALVAEQQSFAAAARLLRVQRSSVSRAVAALEDTLEVQLFARTTRRVSLTTAGAALYARVRPQLAALHEALGSLPEREEAPSGELRITAPTDVAVMLLPDMLAGFLQRYPRVRVDVRVANTRLDLVAEGIDAAIRAAPVKRADSSLVGRRLVEAALHVYAAPTYLAARGTPRSVEDTVAHDWIALRGRPPPSPFPRPERKPRVSADDMLLIRAATCAGLGLGVLPSFLASDDVVAGRLVRVLPKVAVLFGGLSFVHAPAQHPPKKVLALRDYLVDAFARLRT